MFCIAIVSTIILFLVEHRIHLKVKKLSKSAISRIKSSHLFRCLIPLLPRSLHHTIYPTELRRGSDDLETYEDEDVYLERKRIDQLVLSKTNSVEAFLVHDLVKKFNSKSKPVKQLSMAVHHGEVFGLLGVNGAGKTTTFRMLTGDLEPSSGEAYVHDTTLSGNLGEYQKNIGYCPQFDAHVAKLTGEEMIILFGRLRGVHESRLVAETEAIVEMVDLRKHYKRLAENYSGGNRRKLSLAIALIGGPPLLLLDEPTCGVDPGARRKIWNALTSVRKRFGSSMILTSHSMEECECLCSRVGILVAGRLRCLGSIQHLRAKYGQGYTIAIKFNRNRVGNKHYLAAVRSFVEQRITSLTIADVHDTLLTYHVTDPSTTWSHMFNTLEKCQRKFGLEDYAVGDTTLEQIFVSFARECAVLTTRV